MIVFRSVEGFEPPPVELAEAGPDRLAGRQLASHRRARGGRRVALVLPGRLAVALAGDGLPGATPTVDSRRATTTAAARSTVAVGLDEDGGRQGARPRPVAAGRRPARGRLGGDRPGPRPTDGRLGGSSADQAVRRPEQLRRRSWPSWPARAAVPGLHARARATAFAKTSYQLAGHGRPERGHRRLRRRRAAPGARRPGRSGGRPRSSRPRPAGRWPRRCRFDGRRRPAGRRTDRVHARRSAGEPVDGRPVRRPRSIAAAVLAAGRGVAGRWRSRVVLGARGPVGTRRRRRRSAGPGRRHRASRPLSRRSQPDAASRYRSAGRTDSRLGGAVGRTACRPGRASVTPVSHPLRRVAPWPGPRRVFRCSECGGVGPRWAGRCPACEEWNTLVEELDGPPARRLGPAGRAVGQRPMPIAEVDLGEWAARPTGRRRARPGARRRARARLGHPARRRARHRQVHAAAPGGVGRADRGRRRVLYVSAEESAPAGAAAGRAPRRPAGPAVAGGRDGRCPHVAGPRRRRCEPDVLVVDSIQTRRTTPSSARPRARSRQVRECAHRLVRRGQGAGMATVLVGHVTKDGALAGPAGARARGRHRAVASRATATTPCGCCGRSSTGSAPPTSSACSRWATPGWPACPTPAACSSPTAAPGVPGSVVVPTIEGHRPLLVELQALVVPSPLPDAPPVGPGARRRPAGAAARRARAAGRAVDVPACDVYALGRRRRAGRRAGRRPRRGAGRRVGARPRRAAARRPRGLRRGRPRRRAPPGRPAPAGGSPRRPGSGSRGRSCPASAPRPRPARHRRPSRVERSLAEAVGRSSGRWTRRP